MSFREADASPPPEVKPERPLRSPRRQASSNSVPSERSASNFKASPGQRFTSVGLDVLGEFSRRKSGGDFARAGGHAAGATPGGSTLKSPTLATLARPETHTRTNSLPSRSSSSSSSSVSFADQDKRPTHPARSSSLRNGVSSLRRRTNIADPARSQRFIDQVNQVLSPPVSPQKEPAAKRAERQPQRDVHTMSESEEEQDLSKLDALKIHTDTESGSGTARSAKRSSVASFHSDHTASRRQSLYEEDDVDREASASEVSYTTRTPARPVVPDRQQRGSPNKSSPTKRDYAQGYGNLRRQVRRDQEQDVPPLPTTPFPSSSQRQRGSQGTNSSTKSGNNRQRPPIPSEFGMHPRHEEPKQSPSYLSPRESNSRRDRAISPVSPTVNTTSLSRAGSVRLKQHLQQGDADWLPPAPPAAYPQHYQTNSIRDRERKRSLLSSGSGGQHSVVTSGSGGSGSRDEVERHRSSSSALLRRSESPPSTVSSRYTHARPRQREESLPPRPGSAAWWSELDDIKAKAKFASKSNSVAHRSHSRQSTYDEDEEEEMPAELEKTPVAGSTRRRGVHPRAQSVMEGSMPNSAPSRLRSTADFHHGGAGTMPRSRTAMGLNGSGLPTSPAEHRTSTISRGTPSFLTQVSPMGLRRFYEQNNTSSRSLPATPNLGTQRRPPPKTAGNEHHRLLSEAMEHLERTTGQEEPPEYVRKMGILSDLTTTLNLELRTLVADLVEAQVEAEMDVESSGQQSTSANESMKKVEKQLARLLRNSDEQVRSLTEGMLTLSRREKQIALDSTVRGQRPESRATTARRQSLDEDSYTARGSMESDRRTARPSYDEEEDDYPDRSLGSTMTRTKSARQAKRYQSRSEVTPASRNGSRRNKDSNGTVRPSPSFHYPRHSVASTSAVSGETADPGISPTHYARTRAISLDTDHYDYSYDDGSRYANDEDDTIQMPRARRDTVSSGPEEDSRGSSMQGAAATALRLGLNTLTGSRKTGRKYRQDSRTGRYFPL